MKDSWTEIHLPTLRANIRAIRTALGPRVALVAMLKADAYGHGLELVAPCARREGVRHFAVFHLEEAARLRTLAPDAEIYFAGYADPGDIAAVLALRLIPFLYTPEQARGLAREAVARHATLAGHAKIDTGMGRLGFAWETAADTLLELARLPGLSLAGACTHFASAGSPDRAFADLQADRFRQVVESCAARGLALPCRHLAASDALCHGRRWRADAVRPGILLYGYGAPLPETPATRPFLQWKARLVQVKRVSAGAPISYDCTYRAPRPTVIGTIPVGYSDGYFRAWSNRAPLLVNGRRARIAGRVTMNLIMADLGPDSPAQAGDTVTLLGEQNGESVWADTLAALADTISYEVLTAIRAPRLPLEDHEQAP